MPNLIGTAPNQVPVNGLLGTMAFQDSNAVNISSGTIGGVPVSSLAASVLQGEQLDTIASSSSLVLRGGATNLLTYSEQFDNAAWTKTAATITANTVVAPDGSLTGDKLVEDITTGRHLIAASSFSAVTGTTYILSFYAKQSERSLIQVGHGGTLSLSFSNIDLSTGTVTLGTSGHASVTSVGNNWYRVSIKITSLSTSSVAAGSIDLITNPTVGRGASSYTGDGTSGVYIWGAQLEAASTVGAYLKTEATTVSTAYAAPIESPNGIAVPLIASMTPARNGDMTFQLTSNTSLTIKVKGSDGTVRSVALTLA